MHHEMGFLPQYLMKVHSLVCTTKGCKMYQCIAVSFHPMLVDAGNNHLAAHNAVHKYLLSKIFHSQGYLVAHLKK